MTTENTDKMIIEFYISEIIRTTYISYTKWSEYTDKMNIEHKHKMTRKIYANWGKKIYIKWSEKNIENDQRKYIQNEERKYIYKMTRKNILNDQRR